MPPLQKRYREIQQTKRAADTKKKLERRRLEDQIHRTHEERKGMAMGRQVGADGAVSLALPLPAAVRLGHSG